MKPINIAVKLIRERQRQDMTLRQLGDKAGVAHVTIKKIEDGEMPTINTLIKIARALGKAPAWFLS